MPLSNLIFPQVEKLKCVPNSTETAGDFVAKDPELAAVMDKLQTGFFSPNNPGEFNDIAQKLLHWDQYYTLADYRSYIDCQDKVSEAYQVRERKY